MSTVGFDPFEWKHSFIPGLGRDEAKNLLASDDVAIGTFLLRDSSKGGYSLSVKEVNSITHYLIEEETDPDGSSKMKISNQTFPDIPSLLNHYKMRVLETTSLVYAYKKPIILKVIAMYKFNGEKENDLPFEVGETLEIISKVDNDWWEARNALGSSGQIPSNYVVSTEEYQNERLSKGTSQSSTSSERFSSASNSDSDFYPSSFPAKAKVIIDRQPNAYDSTQLRVKKGEVLTITKKHANGMYEAELNGIIGNVPFTYVKFIKPTTKV